MDKVLPIGVSDFKEMIDNNYYYIDKSLFIKEIIDIGAKVILLPRPRRFGKSLNLSMLYHFFEKREDQTRYLFKDLKIQKYGSKYMDRQGQHPVINLDLKGTKSHKWSLCLEKFKRAIALEYRRHIYLLDSDQLLDSEKEEYREIISLKADRTAYEFSIENLSRHLHRYYGTKVIILIDEYDEAIQSWYLHEFYEQVVDFMRGLLIRSLKGNPSLEKGILTGILRVAKESIFSGLNNLSVYTLLKPQFDQYFGLLEDEVQEFLNYYDLNDKLGEVRKWYNGYYFGNRTVYNPWSVVKYIENQASPELFWVNTSSNDLIKNIIAKGVETKEDLEILLKGQATVKEIYENIIYSEIEDNVDSVWSFLLFSGYLKAEYIETRKGKLICELKIPNREVFYLFEDIVINWFRANMKSRDIELLLNSLISGDIATFEEIFKDLVRTTFSYFDVGGKNPEKFYHAFVLGLLVHLKDTYHVKSNRESGYGRYDVMLIPINKDNLGIIIEFKRVDHENNLEESVENALVQIRERNYRARLEEMGVNDIVEIGIAFFGKKVRIKEA